MGNKVTDRPWVQVRFCSYFSFPVPRARFPLPVPRFSNTPLFPGIHSSLPPAGFQGKEVSGSREDKMASRREITEFVRGNRCE